MRKGRISRMGECSALANMRSNEGIAVSQKLMDSQTDQYTSGRVIVCPHLLQVAEPVRAKAITLRGETSIFTKRRPLCLLINGVWLHMGIPLSDPVIR